MHVAGVHAPGRELPDLEKRRAGIEQAPYPLARQELAALEVPFARVGVSTQRNQRDLLLQVLDQGNHALGVGLEFGRSRIDLAFQDRHQPASSRVLPMTRRWMSLAPS